MKLYLDTSAILKRYLAEEGTEIADLVFDKAEAGEIRLMISLWNVGEVFGVLDEHKRKGWLNEKAFKAALTSFADELVKLVRLRALEVMPLSAPVIAGAWNILMDYHIYEADALQISTCLAFQHDLLLSGDNRLVEIGKKAGLHAFNVVQDKQGLLNLLQ